MKNQFHWFACKANSERLASLVVLSVFALESPAHGQVTLEINGDYERLATLESNWLEGPAYDGNCGIWFSDMFGRPHEEMSPTRLMRFDIALGIVATKSENEATNGLAFDGEGRLYAAHHFGGKITRRMVNDVDDVTIFADNWRGRPFSEPNDLAIAQDGGVYFTNAGFVNSAVF